MATTKQNDDDAIFATDLRLVYTPPKSTVRHIIWRWLMLFESTFALSMFEGWEKILIGTSCLDTTGNCPSLISPVEIVTLMAVFWGLLITGIYRYLPYHLEFLYRRAVYYLSGTEQASVQGVGAAMLSTKTGIFTAEL